MAKLEVRDLHIEYALQRSRQTLVAVDSVSFTAESGQFVVAATYRAEFVEALGGLAAHWRACAEIPRRLPICRLSQP